MEKVTRLGVYGVVTEQGKILLIRQKQGPYAGKLDFPGGGMEFGESPQQTLQREFSEEIAMEFDSMHWVANLSATIHVNPPAPRTAYLFHHLGMLYRVDGCRFLNETQTGDLQSIWVNLENLSEEECSTFLWKYSTEKL